VVVVVVVVVVDASSHGLVGEAKTNMTQSA